MYLDNLIEFTPQPYHIEEFYNLKDETNVLFLTYEDLVSNLADEIEKIALFLNISVSKEKVGQLVNHLDINKHKSYPASVEWKSAFRRGIKDTHRDEMSPDMIKKFDEWINKNMHDCPFYKSLA